MPDLPLETGTQDVSRRLDAGEAITLIDVREPYEHATASIAGARLIPMNTVPARLDELEQLARDGALIVFCHHGVRSLNVVNWLRRQGVAACQSMRGGIDDWSSTVDPAVPRY